MVLYLWQIQNYDTIIDDNYYIFNSKDNAYNIINDKKNHWTKPFRNNFCMSELWDLNADSDVAVDAQMLPQHEGQ